MSLLASCAKPQKTVEYQAVKVPCLEIPSDLTSPLVKPTISDSFTYGDSVALNAELFGLLNQANIDRQAIRTIEAQRQ
ncbi:Rz1-like lysis system protein LysC [Rosenbergiella australiborealis]|uniref:Rz1-like lysis system protein LysC n=1 Tax=Rosenbergiella australiborealis TaxID=1544696 RepID=UPI003B84A644